MKNVLVALVALAFLAAPAVACDPDVAQVKKVLVQAAANDHCYDQNVQNVKVKQVVVKEVPVVVKQVQVKEVVQVKQVKEVVQVQNVQVKNVHAANVVQVKQAGNANATNVKVQSAGNSNIKVEVNDGQRRGLFGGLFRR